MRKTALAFYDQPAWPQRIDWDGETYHVVGRWHFLVESASEHGELHSIDLELVDGEQGGCTCRSWVTRKECRHVRKLLELLGLDDVDILPTVG